MKIIICGAGKTGESLIKYLKHSNNDIIVIDSDIGVLKELSSSVDVQTIQGYASHPNILEQAGADEADLIVAMTGSDDANILSCYLANNIFKIPTKIARLSGMTFLDSKYTNVVSKNGDLINKIICPEMEVAKALMRSLTTEWANEIISIADDKMRFIGIECKDDFIFANTSIRQLQRVLPDVNLRVVMLVRDEKIIIPNQDDVILPNDDVYFSIPISDLQIALEKMNLPINFDKKIIVIGGGKIGSYLLRMLKTNHLFNNVKLIEKNETKALNLAEISENVPIICGDIFDDEIQEEIGIEDADVVISLMNEELNIISSLIAKNKGVKRTIATIENDIYDSLSEVIGIDVPIDSHAILISTILLYVRKGNINAVHSLKGDTGEILEGFVSEKSTGIIGKSIQELMNENLSVVYIIRDKEILTISSDTIIQAGDNIALFAPSDAISKAEQMFICE